MSKYMQRTEWAATQGWGRGQGRRRGGGGEQDGVVRLQREVSADS